MLSGELLSELSWWFGGLGFRVEGLGFRGLGFRVYWVAVEELKLSYYIGETLLFTLYTHYGNLISVPYQQPSLGHKLGL